jgi:hypothetical protein
MSHLDRSRQAHKERKEHLVGNGEEVPQKLYGQADEAAKRHGEVEIVRYGARAEGAIG